MKDKACDSKMPFKRPKMQKALLRSLQWVSCSSIKREEFHRDDATPEKALFLAVALHTSIGEDTCKRALSDDLRKQTRLYGSRQPSNTLAPSCIGL